MIRAFALVLAALAILPTAGVAAQSALPAVGGAITLPPPPARIEQVIVVPEPNFTEAAVASCAGGAMIGYLIVAASGAGAPLATSALFCGLSAAASATGGLTAWAWRHVTGP